MLLEIGRNFLFGICSTIGAVIAGCLLWFAAAGLVGTLREVWDGKVGILLISGWFAAGLYGMYKAFLAQWSLFSFVAVGVAVRIWFYCAKITKEEDSLT